MNTIDKIRKARAGLILDEPFFGSLALKLKLVIDETCQTAWTDGISMGFNPTFINNLSLDESKGTTAHEVVHVGLCHHTRRQNRNRKKWNRACDYVVNNILIEAGFTLPKCALIGYKNMIPEEIYNILPDNPEDGNDPGQCGEIRDYPGKDGQKATQSELNQAEIENKIAIAQAAQQAKMMGKLPASLKRFVDEITNPKLDYKEILRRFIDQSAKNNYAWMPPNRRFIHLGLYLPSLHSQQLKNIGIGFDTSGSIGKEDIVEIEGEISGAIEAYSSNAYVMYCDSALQNIEEISFDDMPLDLHPVGGGGTSFVPPFEHIEQNGINMACMLYLTDGQCNNFPKNYPCFPVLWILVGKYKNTNFKPPFGEILEVN